VTGNDPNGNLDASPANLSFGDVPPGSAKIETVTLTNSGETPLSVTDATVSGTAYSLVGLALPATLEVGEKVAFTARFAPSSSGSNAGTITIHFKQHQAETEPVNTAGQTSLFGGAGSTVSTSSEDGTEFTLTVPMDGVGLSASGPVITTQPSNQGVVVGQSATFSVVASGTAPLSYQWRKNGSSISGATATSYTTPSATVADNGALFSVTVTDSVGTVTSDNATLTVTAAPVAPSITGQPANRTVVAGQTATFSVTASGTAPLSYQWRKNGANIGGASGASYTTPATTAADNGAQFSVVVTNLLGSVTSNAATLTVNTPPAITAQPANRSVTAGQTATFSVTATGPAPISYQWHKNGANIGGANAASYTTPATTNADNGARFSVVVSNPGGSVTSNTATLTVTAAPVAPSITSHPANRTVAAGQTASFSVSASGTSPLTYQWRKNGSNISGATSASYTTPATTAADNGAQFSVTVTNSLGTATSNNATLTVTAPPTISSHPSSQTVTAGQTATFSVTATGGAPLTYQWRKNGSNISGATSASYTTPATTAADNGAQFSVVVTNPVGNRTSNAATLTVVSAPSITSQPTNRTVTAGQTAAFSVTAAGTGPLSYQWRKNGSNISGATSASYTTPATVTGDNGAQFSVVVSNSVGSVTSNAATLTVNAATLLITASPTTLNFGGVNVGANKVLPVTIRNTGNSNVTISSVSLSGPGFTAGGVSSGLILSAGQTATLNVTFTPSGTGTATGTATVSSNATNSPATINLTGSGVQHSASLSWTASVSTVSGYNIYRGTVSGGPYTKLNSSLVSTTSYVDSSVQGGTTYFYVVTAVDSDNQESVFSNQATGTIPSP
jgi:hypothetical protein